MDPARTSFETSRTRRGTSIYRQPFCLCTTFLGKNRSSPSLNRGAEDLPRSNLAYCSRAERSNGNPTLNEAMSTLLSYRVRPLEALVSKEAMHGQCTRSSTAASTTSESRFRRSSPSPTAGMCQCQGCSAFDCLHAGASKQHVRPDRWYQSSAQQLTHIHILFWKRQHQHKLCIASSPFTTVGTTPS